MCPKLPPNHVVSEEFSWRRRRTVGHIHLVTSRAVMVSLLPDIYKVSAFRLFGGLRLTGTGKPEYPIPI